MTATYRANTDLVIQAWLATLPGINAGMVGRTLPEAVDTNATFQTSGFVTALAVGGAPDIYVPERQPVMQIDCWAGALGGASRRPQWNVANELAETVTNAVYSTSAFNQVLTLKPGYPTARVQQAHLLQEPRPVYGDPRYFARFHMDVQFYWIELTS